MMRCGDTAQRRVDVCASTRVLKYGGEETARSWRQSFQLVSSFIFYFWVVNSMKTCLQCGGRSITMQNRRGAQVDSPHHPLYLLHHQVYRERKKSWKIKSFFFSRKKKCVCLLFFPRISQASLISHLHFIRIYIVCHLYGYYSSCKAQHKEYHVHLL